MCTWWRALATFACTLATAFPLHANQTIDMVDGARAEIEFIEYLENAPPSGWVPVGFLIKNHAPVDRVWTVRFQCTLNSGSDQLGEWAIRVPANTRVERTFFVPQPWFVIAGSYFQIQGHVTGPEVESGGIYINRTFASGMQTPYTGMSHALATENWSRLEAELDPTKASGSSSLPSPSPGAAAIELVASRFDATKLPADWRTWSGFATIWLHRDDWIALDTAQRLAMQRWVAQGGHLYLAGSGGGLDGLPPLEAVQSDSGARWRQGLLGFGRVTRIPLDEAAPGLESNPRLAISDVAAQLRDQRSRSAGLGNLDSQITVTEAERLVGTIRPGGPLLGLLIATIAILLGPMNIFLFAPAQRRARLFVTVPIISLAGACALIGLILLQDGTGGRGQRGVVIALLPDRPEALVLQEQVSLTGLLFNRDFALPEDTTIVDYSENQRERSYYSGPHREARSGLDRAGTQVFGDWFSSRTVHAHHLRAFVPTRAGLTLTSGAGNTAPAVISTCPGVLRNVVVTDAQSRTWHADEVPPGQSVTLQPAGELISNFWKEQCERFGVSLAAAADRAEPPLSFHATADSWDESVPVPTLPSIRWRNDVILVTGTVREARP